MASGDLIPRDQDRSEPASSEVQFALVISRMVETVKNSPADMRQAIYDLARYKLREQFTYADAKNIRRTEEALEAAIRGVEEFSQQQVGLPAPTPPTPLPAPQGTQVSRSDIGAAAPRSLPSAEHVAQVWPRTHLEIESESNERALKSGHHLTAVFKRMAAVIAVFVGILLAFQQRERLVSLAQYLPRLDWQHVIRERNTSVQVSNEPAPPARQPLPLAPLQAPAKPNPLRPTDFGIYAISNDALIELHLLPGRAPDMRVAVSAAFGTPSQTILPNGHPKFIVFRRDLVSSIADRADVRIVAKIAREFSSEAAGKKLTDSESSWVIRNISFPFRFSPIADNPEMYELHSEDPSLELSPGRYALVLKNQSYDFSIEGEAVDPRQCIERIVSSNGTFYSHCKKP